MKLWEKGINPEPPIIEFTAGKDKLIQIDGMPPETIDFYLEDLRKKARVPDFQ